MLVLSLDLDFLEITKSNKRIIFVITSLTRESADT